MASSNSHNSIKYYQSLKLLADGLFQVISDFRPVMRSLGLLQCTTASVLTRLKLCIPEPPKAAKVGREASRTGDTRQDRGGMAM